MCHSDSYCAAFCDTERNIRCEVGYECNNGLCLLQESLSELDNSEVFPCLDNQDCPLKMVCSKVNGIVPQYKISHF